MRQRVAGIAVIKIIILVMPLRKENKSLIMKYFSKTVTKLLKQINLRSLKIMAFKRQ